MTPAIKYSSTKARRLPQFKHHSKKFPTRSFGKWARQNLLDLKALVARHPVRAGKAAMLAAGFRMSEPLGRTNPYLSNRDKFHARKDSGSPIERADRIDDIHLLQAVVGEGDLALAFVSRDRDPSFYMSLGAIQSVSVHELTRQDGSFTLNYQPASAYLFTTEDESVTYQLLVSDKKAANGEWIVELTDLTHSHLVYSGLLKMEQEDRLRDQVIDFFRSKAFQSQWSVFTNQANAA